MTARLEANRGARATELPTPTTRTCTICGEPFQTRDPKRVKCQRKACLRTYKRLWAREAARDRPQLRGATAPILAAACDALEAQCTPENRPQWPEIIARFDTKPMPGYPNLARITRLCVLAKLRLLT